MSENARSKKGFLYIAIALVVIVGVIAAFMLSGGSNLNDPVAAGQEVVVTIKADSLENMYGYEFRLNYDDTQLDYDGALYSKADGIQTIFSKPFDGHELVGATMIGEQEGLTGKNVIMCEMVFTSLIDGTLGDFDIELTHVNVVKSDMEYLEGLEGWEYSLAVRPAED